MSNITNFDFNGAAVRTIQINGNPWFVAADIARVLEYSEAAAMTRHLDEDEKGLSDVQTPGGTQKLTVISESGLYSAILRSEKPQARAFKKWVTSEVLPSIRKTGQYGGVPATPVAAPLTPLVFEAEVVAVARLLADDRLKTLMPLLWQEITDTAQNALRNVMGTAQLALPGPDTPKALDVVEIAKRRALDIPANLRSAAGRYVKQRSSEAPVVIERLINGSVRQSFAYTNHDEVAALVTAYLATRA